MKSSTIYANGNSFLINDYPGEKGTIVALHGLTGNHKQLHAFASALAGEYRVITYDLLGRGDSTAAYSDSSSIFTHAEDCLALIHALGIEEPILMGYSMGGYAASLAASRDRRVKALVLLDGGGAASEDRRGMIRPSLARLSKQYETPEAYFEELQAIYKRIGVDWNSYSEEVAVYEIQNTSGVWEHKSDLARIAGDFESFYEFLPEQVCPSINCPTLLVIARGRIGTSGPLFPYECYESTIENITDLRTVSFDCNHYTLVFHDQPDIVRAIREFLDDHILSSGSEAVYD